MNISKSITALSVVLTLSACQTIGKSTTPSALLLSGIDAPSISQTVNAQTLSTTDPTCTTFYENTAKYVTQSLEANVPGKPSLGGILLKTLVLGTLSGVSSGAVAAIGIESAFAEAALAATASQMTYNVGSQVYDNVASGDDAPAAVSGLSQLGEIQKAAAQIGCASPDANSIASFKAELDALKH